MAENIASRLSLAVLAGGLVSFSTLLLFYESYNPVVFGRWSLVWALAILVSWSLTTFCLVQLFRGRAKLSEASCFLLAGCGILAGVYSLECWFLENPQRIADFVNLQPFHAVTMAGVLLEWISIILFCVGGALFVYKLIRTRAKRLAAQVLLSLSAFALALVICEGYFRARNLIYPQAQGIPTPSWAIFKHRYYKQNSLGFRDEEPTIAKAGDVIRILCIGDSYTEGVGVRQRDRFTEFLEETLREQVAGRQIEVINAGRADTHTAQHLSMLESMLRYAPDFVVLVYVFNDIEHVRPPVRWSTMNPAKRLLLTTLLQNSHLGAELVVKMRSLGFFNYEPELEASPYYDEQAMSAHLAVLSEFFQKCETHHVPAALAPFDTNIQEEAGLRRYDAFCELAIQRGIPVWRLDQLFREVPFEKLRVSSTDGHPNQLAHKMAGRELARKILPTLNEPHVPHSSGAGSNNGQAN